MSDKVCCKDCVNYCPTGIGTVEDCFAIERGDNYYCKNRFIHIKPSERNKNNDCKWHEVKNEN